ncbi:ATP-binding protein [Campylobacter sp. CCUG 57310]|uniref:ATP-binding protein n=1 Tax=Campylobacter sp. CCUG 57310 TaxID=2517362 RepID=UPI001565F73D|nr:ATP-binding protein [Campylobacter sp. CCUG 57310]QKF92987.1 ATP-binding protein (AAA domain) [Campylobacter sp. CCUG 57310]
MKYLLEFIGSNAKDSNLSALINCNENEAKILQFLSKAYIDGSAQNSVYDVLKAIFGDESGYKFLNHLEDIRSLIDNGWINQSFSIFKTAETKPNQSNLLTLLHVEISLSAAFLKILENGDVSIKMPQITAYDDHLEYLKDQFLRIELYARLALFDPNSTNEAKNRLQKEIQTLGETIKKRLNLSKIALVVEQIFKENSLDENEQIIFLTLLKEEYAGEFDGMRDLNALVGILGGDEFQRAKNRSLLDEGSKLIESGLVDYDEVLSALGNITRSFFINDDILQRIMHPKNEKKSKKLELASIVKEQDIFELIEPTSSIEDVVLKDKTKELMDAILKQVDKKVLTRLSSWGIKSRRAIDVKIIFYGAAGTGKTMSAIGLAKSLKKMVLSFDCSKILSKYVGESEQNVRKIFDTYKEICTKSKSEPVLLLNEADQFLSTRTESSSGADKMHNQMQNIFLEQIEKFEGVLIATTNFLQSLDSAFSRRFDYKIEFKKPDFAARLAIWRKVMPENASFEDGFDIKELAKFDLSGAQIMLVLKNTALKVAIRDDGIFTLKDFENEIKREISSAFDEEKKVGF